MIGGTLQGDTRVKHARLTISEFAELGKFLWKVIAQNFDLRREVFAELHKFFDQISPDPSQIGVDSAGFQNKIARAVDVVPDGRVLVPR